MRDRFHGRKRERDGYKRCKQETAVDTRERGMEERIRVKALKVVSFGL